MERVLSPTREERLGAFSAQTGDMILSALWALDVTSSSKAW